MKIDGDQYAIVAIPTEDAWAVEGNALVTIKGDTVSIRRGEVKPDDSVSTVWYRHALPRDVMVSFRAVAVPPEQDNAANVNIILHARELDGSPVRMDRSGRYDEYHKIPNYIVTLTGGHTPGWSRVRRDPGFAMLSESDIRSKVAEVYDIVATYTSGRVRYYINGKKIHDVVDPNPLEGGHFALRTWSTDVDFTNIAFARIS
jgi:hypothetical protein